ncbi:MAG TPA: hypothetical protein VE753_10305 [Gaiellaceae bacterium]|nr:hypothetical protein [Gaiellaceae bacterium]
MHHRARPKPKPKTKEALVVNTRPVLGNPDLMGGLATAADADLFAGAGGSSHRSPFIEVALGAALLLALLAVALACAPAWALPRSVVVPISAHHDDLLFGGILTAASIAFGLVLVFLLS